MSHSPPNALEDLAVRLDALELKTMDAELAQSALDAVVLRQSKEIESLRRALALAKQRIDTLGGDADTADAGPDGSSLAAQLERDRPPHY